MAMQEIYVDPSIAGNSGAGTSGDPYGDLQYALDTMTANIVDGSRINIKAGTDEVLTASLSLATHGTASYQYPLVFEGYTSAAGDGGVGSIDCNGYQFLNSGASNGLGYQSLELHSGPATGIMLALNNWSSVNDCYIHDTDGHGIGPAGKEYSIVGCRIEDVGGSSYDAITNSFGGAFGVKIIGNYIKQGASRTMRAAINLLSSNEYSQVILDNIISVDGASDGIRTGTSGAYAMVIKGNAILSAAGTGCGIDLQPGVNAGIALVLLNNYVEGFSGTGGIGYDSPTTAVGTGIVNSNVAYNNATNDSTLYLPAHYQPNTAISVLSGSGLEKSGSDTFANRFVYFAPKDEGVMQSIGYPEVDA